jgi:uncharacterized protein (DUF1501 family)
LRVAIASRTLARLLSVLSCSNQSFARELFQLFSVGLFLLDQSGTPVLDAAGERVPTYTITQVTDAARAWTGFARQPARGNLASLIRDYNKVDPMDVVPEWRDAFPKPDLLGGYYGDQLPLCAELPARHFLRESAEWRFLGSSPQAALQGASWDDGFGGRRRLVLDAGMSALFGALCNAVSPGGACRHRPVLTLSSALPCFGAECDVEAATVVGLPVPGTPDPCAALPGYVYKQSLQSAEAQGGAVEGDSCVDPERWDLFGCPAGCAAASGPDAALRRCVAGDDGSRACRLRPAHVVYYEYVRPPCAQLAFFAGGKKVRPVSAATAGAMCADARLPLAAETCCKGSMAYARCSFRGELSSYAAAAARCASRPENGAHGCDDFSSFRDYCAPYAASPLHWTKTDCPLLVKVGADGRVAAVHGVAGPGATRPEFRADNRNWFAVAWEAGGAKNCATLGCDAAPDGCVCPTAVQERAVFTGALPRHAEALAQLRVGALPPDAYGLGAYESATQRGPDGVEAFVKRGGVLLDADTLFKAVSPVSGRTLFLRNVYARVVVQGRLASGAFRNPPAHMSVASVAKRDALFETEALLTHVIEHPSTAPFVATRLIQHLVTSNPSPRYVAAVAAAFRSGAFQGIGSGKHGDLGAAVAAALLDREARSAVLDADPAFGKLREPMNKLVHFARAAQLTPKPGRELELWYVHQRIAQAPYHAPSVFGFYTPDFAPPGVVAQAALVAPEAQLLTGPATLELLNGLMSLARFGLHDCAAGLGKVHTSYSCSAMIAGRESAASSAVASLTYEAPGSDPSLLVQELNVLLTGGRLSAPARAVVLDAVAAAPAAERLVTAFQLMLAVPEFSATNAAQPTTTARLAPQQAPPTPPRAARDVPYKAVVYLYLSGGADSYNVLVPHSDCGAKDLYQDYASARGDIALKKADLLAIPANNAAQPCGKMGLHPALPGLAALYRSGDASFVATVGTLVEPVTKARLAGARLPYQLYAHNVQTRSVDTLDPAKNGLSGHLGRINDELTRMGVRAAAYSLAGNQISLVGRPGASAAPDQLSGASGVTPFDPYGIAPRVLPALRNLTAQRSRSAFAETWSAQLNHTLERSVFLRAALAAAVPLTPFPAGQKAASNTLGQQLLQVARVMQSRGSLRNSRDAFYVTLGGFDTHSALNATMFKQLKTVDDALTSFADELKAQGLWSSVVVVQASEFARTITSNSDGTDHAWAGNSFLAGGGLKGAKVLGKYIDTFAETGAQNLGRGRILPSTSWDHIWCAIAEWLGVDDAGISRVVPNRARFPDLFSKADLFV